MKKSTQKFLDLGKNPSFENLFKLTTENGEKIAAEYLENGKIQTWTYLQLADITEKIATRLQNWIGIENQGRFVGLHLDNFPLWSCLFWGILKAGYNPVLLDFRATSDTLNHLLQTSQAIAILSQDAKPSSHDIFVFRKEQILQDILQVYPQYQQNWGKYVAFCTSGTTTNSKAYIYDEKTFVTNVAMGWRNYEQTPIVMQDGAKVLAFLPFYHIFGLVAINIDPSLCGLTLVYLKDRSPSTFIEVCQQQKITDVYAVPLLWTNLANKILAKVQEQPKLKQWIFYFLCQLSLFIQYFMPISGHKIAMKFFFAKIHKNLLGINIKGCLTGGAHISPKTLRLLISLGFPMFSGFGMTEAGIICAGIGLDIKERLNSSVGPFFPGLEAKLVPLENNTKIGHLLLRGDTLHSGRLENGKILPPLRDQEGWMETGDLAKFDRNKNVYILGRCKDTIIKETGENIYPDEIEDYFRNLPGVQEFCILGVGETSDKEKITLVLSLKETNPTPEFSQNLANAIIKSNQRLPFFKQIDQVFISKNALPTTTTLKPQRQKLKKLLQENSWPYTEFYWRTAKSQKEAAIINNTSKENENISIQQKEKIYSEVRIAFAQILNCPVTNIPDTSHFIHDLGGDSLKAIELAAILEKKLGIFISDTMLAESTNVIELGDRIYQQLYSTTSSKTESITKEKRHPVVCFEDSQDYQKFHHHIEMVGELNPYFVHHDSVVRDTSIVEEKEVINLASYNYLGISGHPEVIQAVQEAVAKYGTSASGSRLLTGEKTLYRNLEREIAAWKNCEDAIVLVSGHATNVTFVGNFCGENDLILYDAFSHNSIDQGCRLSKAESKAFPHNDFQTLENILKQNRDYYEKVLIVVEGVYSMDGDIAPIPEFVAIKKRYGAFLMVDEAHSACVLGKTGKGVDEHFNLLPDDIDIRMGTLSKGLGSCGGYLAGKKCLIDYLRYYLPGFVYSVGITPGNAAAVIAALKVIKNDSSMVQRLHENIDFFVKEAHNRNLNTCLAGSTAIIPIMVGQEDAAFLLSKRLQGYGIFVPPAVYPAVPRGKARLRFCVISEHKPHQIIKALDTLIEIAKKENINLPIYIPSAQATSA